LNDRAHVKIFTWRFTAAVRGANVLQKLASATRIFSSVWVRVWRGVAAWQSEIQIILIRSGVERCCDNDVWTQHRWMRGTVLTPVAGLGRSPGRSMSAAEGTGGNFLGEEPRRPCTAPRRTAASTSCTGAAVYGPCWYAAGGLGFPLDTELKKTFCG
jgi:hypothetical protein